MNTTEETYRVDKTLDLRGWGCPWVLLKARSWLGRMHSGEILEVISSDAQIEKSFPHLFEGTRDQVISMHQRKECYHVLVRRG